jgi:hypothetical protein
LGLFHLDKKCAQWGAPAGGPARIVNDETAQEHNMTTEDPRVIEILGRLAFPHLDTPRPNTNNDPTYVPQFETTVLFPPSDTRAVDAAKSAMAVAIRDKFGEKPPNALRIALRDGNERPQYAGFAGNLFISARSKEKPLLIAWKDKQQATKADIVPGYQAVVQMRSFGYDRNGNKGVGFSLMAVWIVKRDERFDGRPSVQQLRDGLGGMVPGLDVESIDEASVADIAAGLGVDGTGEQGAVPSALAAIMASLPKVT